jgi:hypothetical protein
VKISRRLSHGFTFQGDYVFSKHHESNETTVGFMRTVPIRSICTTAKGHRCLTAGM